MVNYLLQSIPVILVIIIWAIRLEIKIAQIQTDLKWIMKNAF